MGETKIFLVIFFLLHFSLSVQKNTILSNCPTVSYFYEKGLITFRKSDVILNTAPKDFSDSISSVPASLISTPRHIEDIAKSFFYLLNPADSRKAASKLVPGLGEIITVAGVTKDLLLPETPGYYSKKENMLLLLDNAATYLSEKEKIHPYAYDYLERAAKEIKNFSYLSYLSEGEKDAAFKKVKELSELSKKYADMEDTALNPAPVVFTKIKFSESGDFLSFYLPEHIHDKNKEEENYNLILSKIEGLELCEPEFISLKEDAEEALKEKNYQKFRQAVNLFFRLYTPCRERVSLSDIEKAENYRLSFSSPERFREDYIHLMSSARPFEINKTCSLYFLDSSSDTIYAGKDCIVYVENKNNFPLTSEVLLESPPFSEPSMGYSTPSGLYTTVALGPGENSEIKFRVEVPYAHYSVSEKDGLYKISLSKFYDQEIEFSLPREKFSELENCTTCTGHDSYIDIPIGITEFRISGGLN